MGSTLIAKPLLQNRRYTNEFIAGAIRTHGERAGLEMLCIEPGSPWQNGFAQLFISQLRDELLNVEEFENLAEARWFAAQLQKVLNEERPHCRPGYRNASDSPRRLLSSC